MERKTGVDLMKDLLDIFSIDFIAIGIAGFIYFFFIMSFINIQRRFPKSKTNNEKTQERNDGNEPKKE